MSYKDTCMHMCCKFNYTQIKCIKQNNFSIIINIHKT